MYLDIRLFDRNHPQLMPLTLKNFISDSLESGDKTVSVLRLLVDCSRRLSIAEQPVLASGTYQRKALAAFVANFL